MEDMQSKLKEFMNEYNKEKKYTYIFATGTGLDYFFYKDSTLNITSDIVKGLNKKMKELPNHNSINLYIFNPVSITGFFMPLPYQSQIAKLHTYDRTPNFF